MSPVWKVDGDDAAGGAENSGVWGESSPGCCSNAGEPELYATDVPSMESGCEARLLHRLRGSALVLRSVPTKQGFSAVSAEKVILFRFGMSRPFTFRRFLHIINSSSCIINLSSCIINSSCITNSSSIIAMPIKVKIAPGVVLKRQNSLCSSNFPKYYPP